MHDPTERYKINPGFKIQDKQVLHYAAFLIANVQVA